MSAAGVARSPAKPNKSGCSFVNVRYGSNPIGGHFRILEKLFGWKDSKGAVETFNAEDVETIEWYRLNGREFGLSFYRGADKPRLEYTGFKEADLEQLSPYVRKHWNKTIDIVRLSTRGWHWGTKSIAYKEFCFQSNNHKCFEIPLTRLKNVTTTKTDIALELDPSNDIADTDQIVEIRFCVPQPKEGDAVELAEQYKTELLDASGLATGASDAILQLQYKQCQMPHGRFEIQYYPDFLKLHGKSSDFSVPFDNITAMFMLPSPLGAWSCLVLQLATPLRRGQTKYPAVIIQLDDKKEIDVDLNVTPEQLDEMKKIVPEIGEHMSNIEFELAGQVLRALTRKPLIGPSDFRGSSEYPCFRCSQKITPGLFYPLTNRFVFIPKPVVIVRFDEIASVDFGRIQGSQTRLFDFQLTLKNGNEQEFTSVDRQDLQPFMDFITAKGLKVRNLTTISKEDRLDIDEDEGDEDEGGEEDESSDQDFEEGDEEESDADDDNDMEEEEE